MVRKKRGGEEDSSKEYLDFWPAMSIFRTDFVLFVPLKYLYMYSHVQCTTDNLKCSGPEYLVQIIRTSNYPNKIWYKIVKNTKSGPKSKFKLHRNTNYPCSN